MMSFVRCASPFVEDRYHFAFRKSIESELLGHHCMIDYGPVVARLHMTSLQSRYREYSGRISPMDEFGLLKPWNSCWCSSIQLLYEPIVSSLEKGDPVAQCIEHRALF